MDKKLEQLFYCAFGSALAIKDKLENRNGEVKAWQEKAEQNGREVFDELVQRGEKEKGAFKEMLKENLKEIIAELDLATKDDLEKLKKELDR